MKKLRYTEYYFVTSFRTPWSFSPICQEHVNTIWIYFHYRLVWSFISKIVIMLRLLSFAAHERGIHKCVWEGFMCGFYLFIYFYFFFFFFFFFTFYFSSLYLTAMEMLEAKNNWQEKHTIVRKYAVLFMTRYHTFIIHLAQRLNRVLKRSEIIIRTDSLNCLSFVMTACPPYILID